MELIKLIIIILKFFIIAACDRLMLLFFGLIDCSDVPVEIIAMVTNDCVFDGIFRRFHNLPELVEFSGLTENLRTQIFDAIDTTW